MKQFEYFDVTADIGFKAYGENLSEAFENAGLAIFNIISNTCDVKPSKEISFEITSQDNVAMLYDFLEELLFYHEVDFMLFSEFDVEIYENFRLKATIKGESFDFSKHERKSEIKAITFHKMEVSDTNPARVQAIVDL
ncbi:archease [Methanobrevibacter sp.]|uniref:archease n=1 Tax=Methanobrevibacter sp. TaxID=66852 RepID=UPI0026E0A733|nr:archease [Methanobrevibacter sp.]MDO5823602.1 archease [Methanobrevibacter sp.]